MRKLLAFFVLVTGVSVCGLLAELPLRIGSINDYGQTLDRSERRAMEDAIEALEREGIQLVYLASWRDPFSAPQVYARQVFSEWGLGSSSALIVLVWDERHRWRAAGQRGEWAAERLSDRMWEEFRSQAESEANRGSPGRAAISWARNLASVPEAEVTEEGGRRVWPAALVVGGGLAAAVLLGRRWLCPRCLRPLRKRHTWSGIIWACPRCRYARAGRRGSGPGSRGGFRP